MEILMNKLLTSLVLLGLIISINGCNKPNTEKPTSTIFYGGNIITMEGETPSYIEALVVSNGVIQFTGSLQKANEQFKNTLQHDLQGKTLLPGFIDGHLHFGGLGAQAVGANLLAIPDGKVNDIDSLISSLKEWAKGDYVNKGGWIFGMGYDNAVLKEGRHPTKFDLDKVSTTIPVVAVHISGHFAAMNSIALKQMEITAETKNPNGGIIRRISGSQEPNGVLEELAAIPNYMKAISPTTAENQRYFLDKAQELAVSFGHTTIQEGRAFDSSHKSLLNYAKEKGFKIDVVSYLDYSELNSPKITNVYENGYRVGGIKVTLDGSPQGQTAWSKIPYSLIPDGQESGYKGYPAIPDDNDVQALYELAFKNNWQVLTHTNGDAAIDQMLRTMEGAAKKYGNEDRRSVMIHGVFLQKQQYKKLKELNIIPSMFTMHTFYWGDWYNEIIGVERAQKIVPAKSLIDAGFDITIHTDAPVALPNLMQIVWSSVNRTSRSGTIMGAEERISPYQALKAITLWSAYQHFEENTKGSLKKGKLADLVILSENPLTIEPMKINEIKVLETFKEGKSIYQLQK